MLTIVFALAALGAAAPEPIPDGLYLKRDGDGWVWVRRSPVGLELLGPAEAPRLPESAPTVGTLFQPWTAIVTGSWPEAVAIGDLTGDGRNDVALVTSYYGDPTNDYKLFVFAQRPDGTLAQPVRYPTLGTYTQKPETVAVGDVNGDGRIDVVVGNNGMGLGVFLQNAAGALDSVDLHPTPDSERVRVGDVNGDGRYDIVALGTNLSVLRQQPDGTLAPPVTYSVPHGGRDDLELRDVDGDGRTDVVVMSGQTYAIPNLSVLHQQPDGTLGGLASYFIGSNIYSNGAGVGDVTGDGRADVVLSYGGNIPFSGLAVFPQRPDGTLAPPTSVPTYDIPTPVEVADVDGDGREDIAVAHSGWSKLGVYLQNAGGTLDPDDLYTIPYASSYRQHGIAVGDLDQDDAPEVAIADYNHGLVLLRHVPWSVTVNIPNTPVSWVIGTQHAIAWASTLPRYSLVDIALSRDGGATWTPIASDVADSGSYPWTVTGPATAQARIRVTWRTAQSDKPLRSDASDVDFTISTSVSRSR
jgi:hypothetical protein